MHDALKALSEALWVDGEYVISQRRLRKGREKFSFFTAAGKDDVESVRNENRKMKQDKTFSTWGNSV